MAWIPFALLALGNVVLLVVVYRYDKVLTEYEQQIFDEKQEAINASPGIIDFRNNLIEGVRFNGRMLVIVDDSNFQLKENVLCEEFVIRHRNVDGDWVETEVSRSTPNGITRQLD